MDNSALENLSGPGKVLKAELIDAAEFAGLIRTGTTRLHDARHLFLALESRFDLALKFGGYLINATTRET